MMTDVTLILNAIEQGDGKAAERLLPLVYEELRLLAAQKMSQELPGQTLQATALVHDAYIRLVGAETQNWNSRGHFFAAAAEAMRRILVENARRKKSLKYGGDRRKVNLDDQDIGIESSSDDIVALDEALTKLNEKDHEVAELVKLRCFAIILRKSEISVTGDIHHVKELRDPKYARLNDVSTAVIQRLLEHSSPDLTNKVYMNVDPVLRRAIDQIPAGDWL